VLLGSQMLEVGIGIVFLYLLLATVCSSLTEIVARFLGLRSSTLKDGISQLLADPDFRSVAKSLYDHPFIKPLEKNGRPSYIHARTFSMALLDLVAPGQKSVDEIITAVDAATIPDELKQQLKALALRAGADVGELVKGVETWFDDDMERVSGWYKRKSHAIILGLGLAVTICLNADSLAFAAGLVENGAAREAFVAAAATTVDASPAPGGGLPSIDIPKAKEQLGQAGLPLGWAAGLPSAERWPGMVLGWLITAAAVAMGAPFWFDLLTKLTNVRSTGDKPPRADIERAAKSRIAG
jgi:hypothetical protein